MNQPLLSNFPVTTNQQQCSRCLLEVGKQVEKKNVHVQQPQLTATNHNAWKEAADVCFPQMSHFFLKRGLSQFHPIQIQCEVLAKENHLWEKNVGLG